MFEDSDGDAAFDLGGRHEAFPVPDLPPQRSRPTSPIDIPAPKGRKARPSRPRLSAKPPSELVEKTQLAAAAAAAAADGKAHAVLKREAGDGPMQIARSSSGAGLAKRSNSSSNHQIKRSASASARAELDRNRDFAIAEAKQRGIKASAWDAYPGGVMLELPESDSDATASDTDTEDELGHETELQKSARTLTKEGVVVLKLFTIEEVQMYRRGRDV